MKRENAAGSITRQEAVSMIPPLFLDVQPHHRVCMTSCCCCMMATDAGYIRMAAIMLCTIVDLSGQPTSSAHPAGE